MMRSTSAHAEMSDEALVAACGTGDVAALGALYDRHAMTTRRFLARVSGTDDRDLDELVLATFERAARAAPEFDGRVAVRSWLLGIASGIAGHPAAVADADAAGERATVLKRAIVALPPKLRETFVLVYLEGLAGPEVARMLGTREGTTWRRLHAARTRLRELLEGAPS